MEQPKTKKNYVSEQQYIELDGDIVNLKNITMPLLNIYGEYDHLVPPVACDQLTSAVGSKDVKDIAIAAEGFVEFLIVFFGVLVSFSVEQQGENFGDRESNIDNLIGLRDELIDMHEYTLEYIGQNEWVTEMYYEQYLRWDQDNDSAFINYESDEGFHYAPMTYYTNRDAFNPPRVVYDAIKLDGTFRFLGSDIGRLINNNYDGTDLKYLITNTDKEEKGRR